MATLERIRRRSGLLIIVIGLAMAAFVLTDLMGSGNSIFNDYTSVGKIDGDKIQRDAFALKMEEIKNSNPQYANLSSKQLADFAWNMILRDKVMSKEYDALGFTITSDELYFDIINNDQIQQNFTNPNTGQFDENSFKQTLSSIREQKDENPQAREQWTSWINFEKGVKDQSLVFKYNAAVEKGLYTPKALAQADYVAGAQTYQTQFIQLPYTSIVDSTIAVTDSERKAYYNEHKNDYKQEAIRNIEFINFEIVPSAEDRAEVNKELKGLLEDKIDYNTSLGRNDTVLGFANAKNDSIYTSQYSDQPFDNQYYASGSLPANLDSIMFNNEVGFVFGPYQEGDIYKLSKLSEIKDLPDSVKARHILISYQGAERAGQNVTRTPQEAVALADSLYKVVKEEPTIFDGISQIYNDDAVAATKGGDLGYFKPGTMAVPFNNYCFYHKTGDIGLVYTNFGIHIIEITDQKGSNKNVRVATIARQVMASEQTIKDIYNNASTYASEAQRSEDFRALAEEKGLQLRPATNIKAFDENVAGIGQSRKIVQWAWNEDREEGDVGLIDNNGQSYVVVVLTDKLEEGFTPIDKLEDILTAQVRKEKKGEMLVKQIQDALTSNSDLTALAAALNSPTKNLSLNRKSTAISGSGNEPKVLGTIAASPAGVLSAPIAGEGAAYIFTVLSINEAFAKPDYQDEITNNTNSMRTRVAGQLFEALKNNVEVDDKRALFY